MYGHNQDIIDLLKVNNRESFMDNIHSIISGLIDSDDIFRSSFIDELEVRLRDNPTPQLAQDYIYSKLSDIGNSRQYFATNASLGDKALSAILLKTNTPLHDYLKNRHILGNDESNYFDTGSDRFCESIMYYEVKDYNL